MINHETLTEKQTGIPRTNVQDHQQSIPDINTQRLELDKVMLIANTLKGKLNSQQYTDASWLVTTIKSRLKIPIQKFGKPIFSFKRTHEAAVRNSKIMVAFKGDLGAAIAAYKDSPVNYGLEFRDTTALEKIFLHHEDKTKNISIIKHRSHYHLDTIKEKTRKSDQSAMIIRGNHKSSQSVLNAAALNKTISKEIDHGWALPLIIESLQRIKNEGVVPLGVA